MTLTRYGLAFAECSEQLLMNVEAVLADIDKVSQERTGLVTVAHGAVGGPTISCPT